MNFIIFTRDSIKQKWRGGQSGTYQRLTIGVVGSTGERREDVEMKRKSEKNWSFRTKTLCSKASIILYFFVSSLHLNNAHLQTRRRRSSVLGKCRSVPPSIFVCFLPLQVFPYYVIIIIHYGRQWPEMLMCPKTSNIIIIIIIIIIIPGTRKHSFKYIVCVFQSQPTALLGASGSAQGG